MWWSTSLWPTRTSSFFIQFSRYCVCVPQLGHSLIVSSGLISVNPYSLIFSSFFIQLVFLAILRSLYSLFCVFSRLFLGTNRISFGSSLSYFDPKSYFYDYLYFFFSWFWARFLLFPHILYFFSCYFTVFPISFRLRKSLSSS